jgi:TolB-like protein
MKPATAKSASSRWWLRIAVVAAILLLLAWLWRRPAQPRPVAPPETPVAAQPVTVPVAPPAPIAESERPKELTSPVVVRPVVGARAGPEVSVAVPPTAVPGAPPTSVVEPARPRVSDPSIVVLPFAGGAEEILAEALADEIATRLAFARELRVVSRLTASQYRDAAKPLSQIGEELNVAYALQGTVARSGQQVRVSVDLIEIRSGEHAWSKVVEKELGGISALLDELMQGLARALQGTLTPQEIAFVTRPLTANPEACHLYLQGRLAQIRGPATPAFLHQQEDFFQRSAALDPQFAAAWGELAVTDATLVFFDLDHSAARLAGAKAAMDKATTLAAGSPEIIGALGRYYYGLRDYDRAAEQVQALIQLQPKAADNYAMLGLIQRHQGKWVEAVGNQRKAVQLEPGSVSCARDLAALYASVRRQGEAVAEQCRIIALRPDQLGEAFNVARQAFLGTGVTRELDEFVSGLAPDQAQLPRAVEWRKYAAYAHGNHEEWSRLDKIQPYFDDDGDPRWKQAVFAAYYMSEHGMGAAARERVAPFAAELKSRLELEPANASLWAGRAEIENLNGNRAEALRCAQQAVALVPESSDAMTGPIYSGCLAGIMAWGGDKDSALAEVARLIRLPSAELMTADLRVNPFWAPLRGDRRFEALLNDPKNRAPLF